MKPMKVFTVLLALCFMLALFSGCGSDKTSTEGSPAQTECEHEFKDGYCTKCEEMDPDCTELTAENYEDYLKLGYKVTDINGNTNMDYAAFVRLLMSASPTSDRCTFYNVKLELEVTVKQALYPSGSEEYTTTVEIPISLFGEGEAVARLDRESSSPVLLKTSYISDYKIISITGCVAIN